MCVAFAIIITMDIMHAHKGAYYECSEIGNSSELRRQDEEQEAGALVAAVTLDLCRNHRFQRYAQLKPCMAWTSCCDKSVWGCANSAQTSMKIIALCYASPVLSRHAKRKAPVTMRMFQKILSMNGTLYMCLWGVSVSTEEYESQDWVHSIMFIFIL